MTAPALTLFPFPSAESPPPRTLAGGPILPPRYRRPSFTSKLDARPSAKTVCAASFEASRAPILAYHYGEGVVGNARPSIWI